MMKLISIVFLITGLLMLGLSISTKANTQWQYSDENGPEHWHIISPKFAACGAGKNQSPINLTGMVTAEQPTIQLNYQLQGDSIINNGHTVKLDFRPNSHLELDGQQFNLVQVHFHGPSEHQVNGKSYPLEAHLVHQNNLGDLAVVGVLFELGDENPALNQLWQNSPVEPHKKVDWQGNDYYLSKILPEDKDHYRYNGSLTTPPCSEGVRWIVLKQPLKLSQQQVEQFSGMMNNQANNRPIQAINARIVYQ